MRTPRDGSIFGALERIGGALCRDFGGDHRDAALLAGSGRSGTTWLADLISRGGGYRLVFEPFHPERRGIREHFNSKQYLRADDEREDLLAPARAIFSGKDRSLWTDRFRGRLLARRRRLVKDIRANLMLGWVKANFPEMPVILLLRHPCAVVLSRLRLGWRDNLDETMRQRDLLQDFLTPFEAEMGAARTPFERHVFLWCIDNYVPLMQLGPDDLHLVFHEHLRDHPEAELRRLLASLGQDLDARALRVVNRPSSLSRNGAVPPPGDWRGHLSREQIRRASEILNLFGLDAVYGEDPTPDAGAARALMQQTSGHPLRPGGG